MITDPGSPVFDPTRSANGELARILVVERIRWITELLAHEKVRRKLRESAPEIAERWPRALAEVLTGEIRGREVIPLLRACWPAKIHLDYFTRWLESRATEGAPNWGRAGVSDVDRLCACSFMTIEDDEPVVLLPVELALVAEAELDVAAVEATREVLHHEGKDPLAGHHESFAILRDALARRLPEALVAAGLPAPAEAFDREIQRLSTSAGGAHHFAVGLASYLESMGERAAAVAKDLVVRAAKNPGAVREWVNPTVAAWWLARALWHAEVRPRLERARRNPPALSLVVMEGWSGVTSRASKVDVTRRLIRAADGSVVARIEPPPDAPALDDSTLEGLIHHLRGVTGHRFLHWTLKTGHRQWLDEHPQMGRIVIDGGFEAMAEHLELTGDWVVSELRRVVRALACVRVWPDGSEGNLLAYHYQPAQGQKTSCLRLTLGDELLPTFVHSLEKKVREARKLVPLVELPPLVKPNQSYGPQLTFHSVLLIDMRREAAQLVKHGGVSWPRGRLKALAEHAGLGLGSLDRVLDRWTRDGDDGPAFLARERDLYRLGRAHEVAHLMMIEGQKREVENRERGRRAAKKRWSKK